MPKQATEVTTELGDHRGKRRGWAAGPRISETGRWGAGDACLSVSAGKTGVSISPTETPWHPVTVRMHPCPNGSTDFPIIFLHAMDGKPWCPLVPGVGSVQPQEQGGKSDGASRKCREGNHVS